MRRYTGNDVKRVRTTLKLTQEDMAQRLGVTVWSVSRWEHREPDKPISSRAVQILLAQLEAEANASPKETMLAA
jgi:DNA-binding transcriptional regulator YiaG